MHNFDVHFMEPSGIYGLTGKPQLPILFQNATALLTVLIFVSKSRRNTDLSCIPTKCVTQVFATKSVYPFMMGPLFGFMARFHVVRGPSSKL